MELSERNRVLLNVNKTFKKKKRWRWTLKERGRVRGPCLSWDRMLTWGEEDKPEMKD